MERIEWDKENLGRELTRFFCEFFGVAELNGETPMEEIRARFELVGTCLGRTLAVVNHEGPVGVDIAMAIRASEQEYKDRCSRSVNNLCRPGGALRVHWNRNLGID